MHDASLRDEPAAGRPAAVPGTPVAGRRAAAAPTDHADAGVRTPIGRAAGGTDPGRTRWVLRLALVGMVLAAVNLRPAITSLGAVLQEVRDSLGMDGTVAGLLTSVPAACFALFGFAAPRLARRFGPAAVVCAGMVALCTGLALRPLTGSVPVFLAVSALALAGIAVSNVLMPVIVKRYFADRVGTMTGVYSMALSLGTSVAAAITVPLTGAVGGSWRLGLGLWAVPAALAVLPWLPLVRDHAVAAKPARAATRLSAGQEPGPGGEAAGPAGERVTGHGGGGSADRSGQREPGRGRITRSRTAWMVAGYFGLQSTAAYVTMGWLPQILRDAGISAGTAGVMLAITMALGVPLSFVLPPLAARMRSQGPIAVALGVFQLVGFAGLWLAPAAAPWVWALLLGVAMCAFPLVLTMIPMRSRSAAGVVRLSAFAQSTGYLLAIPGPILVGALNQSTGGWGLPLALMTALVVPQVACGVAAGRSRHVEDEL